MKVIASKSKGEVLLSTLNYGDVFSTVSKKDRTLLVCSALTRESDSSAEVYKDLSTGYPVHFSHPRTIKVIHHKNATLLRDGLL